MSWLLVVIAILQPNLRFFSIHPSNYLGKGGRHCHHLEGQDQVGLVQAGYDYDAFKLFARMGGSPVRVKLLNILWQVLQGTASSLQMSLTLTGRP